MMPDADKLNELLGKFVNDLGAALHAGMVVIGDKLGLYKALARPAHSVSGSRRCRAPSGSSAPEATSPTSAAATARPRS